MSNGKPQDDSIGALWEKTSGKGMQYMSGTINGVKVVLFRNRDKRSDKAPDWKIYVSQPMGERRARSEPQSEESAREDGW